MKRTEQSYAAPLTTAGDFDKCIVYRNELINWNDNRLTNENTMEKVKTIIFLKNLLSLNNNLLCSYSSPVTKLNKINSGRER